MSTLVPLAVQLYSLRDAIAQDLEGTLKKLAQIGYAGAEPYGGIDYKQAAPLLKSLGMDVPSMHSNLPLGDDQAAVLDMATAYGVRTIVAPWRPPEEFATADGVKRTADVLNQANKVAKDNGFAFGYHNHWFEFQTVNGRSAYDILRENLDPDILLQVDTYWVKVAGHDPAALVRDLGSRAPLLHIKDGPAVNRDDPMTAVGEGSMDVKAIVNAGAGITQWLIVELDRCATDMMTAVEKSYHYMVKEGLGRGR